jgi:hypothetical protein
MWHVFCSNLIGGALCSICKYFYQLDWSYCCLVFGHTLVEADYSGVYFDEQLEELLEAESVKASSASELNSEDVPGDGNPILADKYNYLKIENVFQGRLNDTKELFSFEVAIATYQTNVTADFFIKAIYEIEAELVSEISTIGGRYY